MREPYSFRRGSGPLVAVALHAGHDLSLPAAAAMALSAEERRREEDPFTDEWLGVGDHGVEVHRSRFEVDLNRPRGEAVYATPEQAWGLEVWRPPGPPDELVAASLATHDRFRRELAELFHELVARHGRFVVLDLHSYNHRREGPQGEPAEPAENPEINLGTGTLDRERWAPVVDAFLAGIRSAGDFDVRENVRFRGGAFPAWVHETFPETGCALAIEVKKVFMDEWTGRPDPEAVGRYGRALESGARAVRATLEGMAEVASSGAGGGGKAPPEAAS